MLRPRRSSVKPSLEGSHGSPQRCQRLQLRHEAAAESTPLPVSPRSNAVESRAEHVSLQRCVSPSRLRGAQKNDPPGALRAAGGGPGGCRCDVPEPSLCAAALLGERAEQDQLQRARVQTDLNTGVHALNGVNLSLRGSQPRMAWSTGNRVGIDRLHILLIHIDTSRKVIHFARQHDRRSTHPGSSCSVTGSSRRPSVIRQVIGAAACTAHLLPGASLSRDRSGLAVLIWPQTGDLASHYSAPTVIHAHYAAGTGTGLH